MTFWWVESTVKLSCLAGTTIRDPLSVSVMDSSDSSPYMAWSCASGNGARPKSNSEWVRCLFAALYPTHIYRNLLFIVPSLSLDRLPACLPALPCFAFLPPLGLLCLPGDWETAHQGLQSLLAAELWLTLACLKHRHLCIFFFVIFILQADHLHAEKRMTRSSHACKGRDSYRNVNDSDSYGEFDNGTN